MAPIPIHTKSPINAAKADGVSPQTAAPSDEKTEPQYTPATTTTTAQTGGAYPAAQPGAVPHLPAVTQPAYAPVQTTPTTSLNSQGPPPPQPGAIPSLPSVTAPPTASGPPPPTITAPARLPGDTSAPPPMPVPYPAQMAIPAPTMPYVHSGTTTTSAEKRQQTVLTYQLDHPVGYQQNANAAEMTSSQREATHQSAVAGDTAYGGSVFGRDGTSGGVADEEGLLGIAKKWALAAGDKLSAAEQEVWKRLSGGQQ